MFQQARIYHVQPNFATDFPFIVRALTAFPLIENTRGGFGARYWIVQPEGMPFAFLGIAATSNDISV